MFLTSFDACQDYKPLDKNRVNQTINSDLSSLLNSYCDSFNMKCVGNMIIWPLIGCDVLAS